MDNNFLHFICILITDDVYINLKMYTSDLSVRY